MIDDETLYFEAKEIDTLHFMQKSKRFSFAFGTKDGDRVCVFLKTKHIKELIDFYNYCIENKINIDK